MIVDYLSLAEWKLLIGQIFACFDSIYDFNIINMVNSYFQLFIYISMYRCTYMFGVIWHRRCTENGKDGEFRTGSSISLYLWQQTNLFMLRWQFGFSAHSTGYWFCSPVVCFKSYIQCCNYFTEYCMRTIR